MVLIVYSGSMKQRLGDMEHKMARMKGMVDRRNQALELSRVRALNLSMLVEQRFGTKADFARAYGWEPTYAYRYFTEDPVRRRNMSDVTARQIEAFAGLDRGWMDEDRPSAIPYQHRIGQLGGVPLLEPRDLADLEHSMAMKKADPKAITMLCPIPHGPNTYVMKVGNLAMRDPGGPISLKEGEFIFVDPSVKMANGKLVVAWDTLRGRQEVRQLIEEGGKKFLKASNPTWHDPLIQLTERYRLVGVVIGHFAAV